MRQPCKKGKHGPLATHVVYAHRNGYRETRCVECRREASRLWNKRNVPKRNELSQRYRTLHKDRINAARRRARRTENAVQRAQTSVTGRLWDKRNHARRLEIGRRYRELHGARINATKRRQRAEAGPRARDRERMNRHASYLQKHRVEFLTPGVSHCSLVMTTEVRS